MGQSGVRQAPEESIIERLDTRIPLMGREFVVPDLLGMAQKAQQLQAGTLELDKAQDEARQRQLLDELIPQHIKQDPTTGATTIDQQGMLGAMFQASPRLGMEYEKQMTAQAGVQATAERAKLARLKDQLSLLNQVTTGVIKENTQWAYDQGRQILADAGVPNLETLPPQWGPEAQQKAQQFQALSAEKGQALEEALKRMEVQEKIRDAQRPNYTGDKGLDARLYAQYGHELSGQGGVATPEQVGGAIAQEDQAKLNLSQYQGSIAAGKAADVKRATMGAEQGVTDTRTLLEVQPSSFANYLDTATGQPVDPAMPWLEVKQGIRQKQIVPLSNEQAKDWSDMEGALPVLQEMRRSMEQVYGPGGIFAKLQADGRLAAAVKGGWQRLTQEDPEVAVALSQVKGNVEFLQRVLRQQRGAGTEPDVIRGLQNFPSIEGIPDTAAVAERKFNVLLQSVEAIQRKRLRNPQFTPEGLGPVNWTGKAQPQAGAPPVASPRSQAPQGTKQTPISFEQAIQQVLKDKPGWTRQQAEQALRDAVKQQQR